MTQGFSGRPKLLQGALVVYESQVAPGLPRVIAFQYNPEQIQRKLELRAAKPKGGANAKEEVLRVEGPPKETLTLSITLNATDQLEHPGLHPQVVEQGLHPALACLELLLYPSTFRVLENEALAASGAIKVKPADMPLTLLVWGKSRVVPVKIDSMSITEEAFDPALNPIQAKVELGLSVLSYMELDKKSAGRDAYLAHQKQKEMLATQHRSFADEANITNMLPNAGG